MAEQLNLNWARSKFTVSKFTDMVLQTEKMRNPEFRALNLSAIGLCGIYYDLGHYGRGYDDFPKIIPLAFESLASTRFFVDITIPEFYNPLSNIIEDYLKGKNKLTGRESILRTMRFLDTLEKQKLSVHFEDYLDDWRVYRMETDSDAFENKEGL